MKYILCKIHDFMVKYLVGLATQFRNKKCVTYLAGLLIIIFEKSPPGQLNCRVAKYFWGQSPNGSVIWPGQLIGTQEYMLPPFYQGYLIQNLHEQDYFGVQGTHMS